MDEENHESHIDRESHCGVKEKPCPSKMLRNPQGCLRLLKTMERMPELTFPYNHIRNKPLIVIIGPISSN